MRLSTANLEVSRTKSQSSETFLSIFTPTVAMACLVSGTVSSGARDIPYKSVSTGSYINIESGMTMLVGTSAGGDELGKIRVKSATVSNIVVAENSHINWPLATHLTIQRYYELWPIYPKIITDPSDDENVLFYKDYDVAYTNQNSILGAFPCAGTHRAGFVGDSFYYSATGTSHLLGSALTYDWAFEGGGVTGSTSATPGYIQYNTPGHYVTRLIVTGANGSVDITYRYVSVYNRPGASSSNLPIQKWEIAGLSGSRGEGGYSASIGIIDEIVPTIRDGQVVVLWSDDYYGANHISLGGNSPNNSNIFFVGHITNGSIRYDYRTSRTEFEVSSITDIMKSSEGFSVSVESKASPSKWFEMLDMDGQRAIYHYLKWHSTTLLFNDVAFVGTDRKIQYFDSDRESIFDAVDNYMRGTLLGTFIADRQGKLWAEIGAVAYTNPTGSFPTIQEITKRDWMGEPSIRQQLTPPTSFIEMGGVAYSGTTTGTYSALIGCAPGQAPNVRGSVERMQGLALLGQSQLNELVGNVYANKNAKYPTISMGMAGNYAHFDIAPQETVDINILDTDTNTRIPIHAPYLIDSVSWSFDSKNKIRLPSVEFVSLVNGTSGETITIPDIPDGGGYSDFGGGFEGFSPGKIPAFLPSLVSSMSGIRFWQGTLGILNVYDDSEFSAIGNYTQLNGDSSLVQATVSGFPMVMEDGLYFIRSSITCSSVDVKYIQLIIDTTNSVYSSSGNFTNHAKYIGATESGYPLGTASIDGTALYYLLAGDRIEIQFAWLSDNAFSSNKSVSTQLDIIKLG